MGEKTVQTKRWWRSRVATRQNVVSSRPRVVGKAWRRAEVLTGAERRVMRAPE